MAIGKVNAYATVDAPKADFGAVAQMNIDNLVKSVKEDEQAKAVKKAAADKALDEKMDKLALFPDQVKSGTQSLDFEQAKNYSDLYDQGLVFRRTYEASGGKDIEAKMSYDRIIASMKNTNAELKVYGDDLVAVNARIGRDEVYSKYKNKINEISTAAAEGRLSIKTDPKTQVKYIAEYIEDPDNPGQRKLGEYRPASEHLKLYRNAPANINYQEILTEAKNTFSVSLTENAPSYTRKTGDEKLAVLQKTGIYDYFLKMVEDDSKAAAIGDQTGVIGKEDYRVSGFKSGEKQEMARIMADRVISAYGTKHMEDANAPQQPTADIGSVKKIERIQINTTSTIIKADEENIATTKRPLGSSSTFKALNKYGKGASIVSIPIGTRTYPLEPEGKEVLSPSLGIKMTGIAVLPNGTFFARGVKIAKQGGEIEREIPTAQKAEGVETETVRETIGTATDEVFISSKTNGNEYNDLISLITSRKGETVGSDGRVYPLHTRGQIESFIKKEYERETGKKFPVKTTSTGGPSKRTNATQNTAKSLGI